MKTTTTLSLSSLVFLGPYGSAQTVATNQVGQAQVIKIASRLAVGMREEAADELLRLYSLQGALSADGQSQIIVIRTVEALSGGKPLAAVAQQQGALSCAIQDWSYKEDTITSVEVLEVSTYRPCAFIDLVTGQTNSEIPREAFDFID